MTHSLSLTARAARYCGGFGFIALAWVLSLPSGHTVISIAAAVAAALVWVSSLLYFDEIHGV
jgi:hypothetical protein